MPGLQSCSRLLHKRSRSALSEDLGDAFPDMQGLSPRNLKYMRAFAATWPNRRFVQEVLAQITWHHCIAPLDFAVVDRQVLLKVGDQDFYAGDADA